MMKMVLAAIFSFSEHLVGTRYYLFFFFSYTFSPFLPITLWRCPSAEGNTEAEATQVTELETAPHEPNQVGGVPHICHAAGVGRSPDSEETRPHSEPHTSPPSPSSPPLYISEIQFQRHLPKHLLRERPSDGCPWGDVRKRKLASISGYRHSCKLSGKMPHGLRQL